MSHDVEAWINGMRMTDLRFADDIAVLAENVTDLQEAVDRISTASMRMGMRINTSKTETQFLGKGDKRFDIQVNGQCLHQTERFIYLGGTISSKEGSEADVSRRIGIARGIFHTLSKVWTSKDIKKSMKIEVFEILVLSSLFPLQKIEGVAKTVKELCLYAK